MLSLVMLGGGTLSALTFVLRRMLITVEDINRIVVGYHQNRVKIPSATV